MIDSYFDLDNFRSPVKTYLTQKYFYYMDSARREDVEIFIKENQIRMLDDYTYVEGVKDNKFYTIKEQKQNSYLSQKSVYSSFNIFLDPEIQYYNRNVYTIFDFFSQIGGIFSLVSSLCGLLVGFYSERLMYYTILSKCYSFDTDNIDKNEEERKEIVSARKSFHIKDPTHRKINKEIKDNVNEEFEGGKVDKHATQDSKNLN
jgi:hypothetical protein